MAEVFPVKTPLERVQRIAEIVRTVPMKWTDSKRFEEADLSLILGFINARYRINTPDRFFIVQTMAPQISEEMLKRAGIEEMTSCFLIAVRSLLGDDFPEITTDNGAAEILRLNSEFTNASETIGLQIEAVYSAGKCERTGRDFRFEDWIEESNSAARKPDADQTHGFTKTELCQLTGYSDNAVNQRLKALEITTAGGGRPRKGSKPFSKEQVQQLLQSIIDDEGSQQFNKTRCEESLKTL
jgi:hypothetical protein